MSDDDAVVVNTKNLDKLIKILKKKVTTIQVGILGGGQQRSGKNTVSNATIGSYHEFGTSKLPRRSFLREPISDQLPSRLENSGAFDKEVLKKVMESGDTIPWLEKIAVLAEGIVADAFDTGGFGKWIPSNMKDKKNQQTLVETTQLRNSITSIIKE